jgi:sugar lactone lactonase YvrE
MTGRTDGSEHRLLANHSARVVWRHNLPDLLGLPASGMDDADSDSAGNVWVSSSATSRVLGFGPDSNVITALDIPHGGRDDNWQAPSIATVSGDIYIADPAAETLSRYSERGEFLGVFAISNILSICHGMDGTIYVLSNPSDIERIEVYDALGMVSELPAPTRHSPILDPAFVKMDCDGAGNVYVSYGMAPYAVWRISADGDEIREIGREIDYPEDAVLVNDLAFDASAGILWTLLACRGSGLQLVDAFTHGGRWLGALELPQSENLFGVICPSLDGDLYLLDTGTGPGSGDLIRITPS